jgi:hypothetical protein
MDRRAPLVRSLTQVAVAAWLLVATSCMSDAGSWVHDLFVPAPKARPVDELVEPDPDIGSRDLFWGVGGRELAPRPDAPYHFVRKDTSGFSDNFELEDPSGRRYDAKIGHEAQTEVAASRLLWAIGFYQPPVYYVRQWQMADGPEAGRPQPHARFRFQDPSWKGKGIWSWKDNPFDGTRELNGLVVMNVMMNNWDLKTSNNKIYERRGERPGRVYVVKDLGESFGHSVRFFLGGLNDEDAFAKEPFILRVNHDQKVYFGFEPIILNWGIDRDLHVDDVLWTCRRLEQLSDEQWTDAFRAAGYSDREIAVYVDQMKRKMREGLALEQRARS